MKAARTRALNKKHAGTAKHHHTVKHTGTATRAAAKAHKQKAHRTAAQVKAAHLRAWSPDEDVAMCSARAVAQALKLAAGVRLSDEDVLAVYWSTATTPDEGQTLSDALSAARGALPLSYRAVLKPEPGIEPGDLPALGTLPGIPDVLILGLDLPWGEPHAVTVDLFGNWWSWQQMFTPADFPGAVIEEAWAVTVA